MGMLRASRCRDCGFVHVPPRDSCHKCALGRGRMDPAEVEGRGKVISWTTMEVTPEGFDAPRTVALVEFASGARAMCICDREPVMEEEVLLEERDGEIRLS